VILASRQNWRLRKICAPRLIPLVGHNQAQFRAGNSSGIAISGYHRGVPKYSIVVPFHNEEENVTTLYDRVKLVMEQVGDSFEMVFVDDGSRDRTYGCWRRLRRWTAGCW